MATNNSDDAWNTFHDGWLVDEPVRPDEVDDGDGERNN